MQYRVEEISVILVCQQSKFTLKHTLDPLYVGHVMTRDEDYFKVLQVFFCFPPYEGTSQVHRIQMVIDVRYLPQSWGGCGFDSLRFPWGKVLKT